MRNMFSFKGLRVLNNPRTVLSCFVVGCTLWILLRLFGVSDKEKRPRFVDIYRWNDSQSRFCGGNYLGYGSMFFRLNTTLYEPIKDVFTISCKGSQERPKDYTFTMDHYAPTRYTKSLVYVQEGSFPVDVRMESNSTIVIFREYPHNFYHAMTQWYNIYIISKIFQLRWLDMHVLLLDRGPVVHIDEQWKLLFPKVTKTEQLTSSLLIKDAIFNIAGHSSPMYLDSLYTLPYIEEFSTDILRQFNMNNDKKLECSNLTVTLVSRRDYFFHPGVDKIKRNTQRKYQNEEELVQTLKHVFAGHNVRTMISETMPLREQIGLAVQTDIFIAMHGCALTHILFLPRHGAVLELYPVFWKIQPFFSSIAKWRSLTFNVWQNKDKNNEFPDHYTRVPPEVLMEYGAKAKMYLGCTDSNVGKQT